MPPQEIEQNRALLLAEQRAQKETELTRKREFEKIKKAIQDIKKSIPPKLNFIEVSIMGSIALFADVVDLLVVGSIPVIGDILDIAVWALIAFWVWWRRLKQPPGALKAGIAEIVPFLDVLPIWIAMVVYIVAYNITKRIAASKKIKELEALEKQAKIIASPQTA